MFPNIDPKKMQAVMKQMGLTQEEIASERVIIEKSDNSRIIIENPSVTKIKIQGQESFQILGDIREESTDLEISEEDVKTVMQKTGTTKKQALKSLEKTRNLADSILELSK